MEEGKKGRREEEEVRARGQAPRPPLFPPFLANRVFSLPIYLPIYLPTYLSIYLPTYLPIYLST
jgi:hypothetical protein